MRKWQKRLTSADRKHLREIGCGKLREFKAFAAILKTIRERHGDEICYKCRAIAQKLGLPA